MHCPSCGAETTLDHKFCRSCGMDLETVSKLVVAHSSPETLKREKTRTKKAVQRRMYQLFKWGMICTILGMAALATTRTLGFDKTFNLAPLLLVFMGMLIMVSGLFSPLRASNSPKILNRGRTGELHEVETTKELTPARVPVPVLSVTERTTQLIAPLPPAEITDSGRLEQRHRLE